MKKLSLLLVCVILFLILNTSALALIKNSETAEYKVAILKGSFSGVITDAKSGNPLHRATVYISDLKVGAATNNNGEFYLRNIPEGRHLVEISFIGFTSITQYVNINGNTKQDFSLNESIVENNEVIITGVSSATQSKKVSTPITVVKKEELFTNASVNIVEALTKKPGVSSITSGPGVSKPVIRGLGYNRVITMNDGIKQEGQQWGDEHGIEIDELSVSRVEILKGPAALIYGSDALAGVINIITNVPVAEGNIEGNLLGNYQTNNNLKAFNANVTGNIKGINWNIYGTAKQAADYKNKLDGKVFNSKFNENNFGGYGGYNSGWGYSHILFSNFDQHIGLVEGERDVQGYFIKVLPGGMETRATGDDFKETDPFVPMQHIRHSKFVLDNNFNIGKVGLAINAGYQRNQRQEFGNADNVNEVGLFFDLKTYSYTARLNLPEKNNWKFSFGVNGINQQNRNRGIEFLIPDYTLNDLGGYVYVKKEISKLNFSGGVRYDNRSLNSKMLLDGGTVKFDGFKRNFSNFSGSIGTTYLLNKGLSLKANIARGFRAPGIPELASNGSHEGTNRYEFGDKNLTSETSMQLDGGLEFYSDHLSFSTSVFYNSFPNFIFYRKLASVNGGDSTINLNGDDLTAFKFEQRKAALSGFEITFDIHPHPLDWLHIENTFSYVSGRLKQAIEGSKYLPSIPATKLITEFRGNFLRDGTTFSNLYAKLEFDNTFSKRNIFNAYNTETTTDGYLLLNAGVGTDVVNRKKEKVLSISFTGSNLADVAYQNHLSRLKYAPENMASGREGVFNMGRNFSIKINVPFNLLREDKNQ
jgi:iron complex outermembrane receptor protein